MNKDMNGEVFKESGAVTVEVTRCNFPKTKQAFSGFAIVQCVLDSTQDGEVPTWLRRLGRFGVKGVFPYYPQAGDLLDVHYTRYEKNKFGVTLDGKNIQVCARRDERSVRALLKQLPQVGSHRSREMFEKFGGLEGVLDVLDHSPERLTLVRGITADRASEICRWWTERSSLRDGWVFLAKANLSPLAVGPLTQKFGAHTRAVLTSNPFAGMSVVSFRECDVLRAHLGMSEDDPRRVAAAAVHLTASACRNRGDTWVDLTSVMGEDKDGWRNKELVKDMGVTRDQVAKGLQDAQKSIETEYYSSGPQIVQEDDMYSPAAICDSEYTIAARLRNMLQTTKSQ